jgi:hypothetical protein
MLYWRGESGKGRPKALNAKQLGIARDLYDDPKNSIAEICRTLKISRPTLYRSINTKSSSRKVSVHLLRGLAREFWTMFNHRHKPKVFQCPRRDRGPSKVNACTKIFGESQGNMPSGLITISRSEKPRLEATRFYLQSEGGQFSAFMWMRNARPNELLLGFYGISHKNPSLTFMFPDRIVPVGSPARVHYQYSEASLLNVPFDHISCHQDGRFHIKRSGAGAGNLYSHVMKRDMPITPEISTFLEMEIITDFTQRYVSQTTKPKHPHVVLAPPPEGLIVLEAWFSGAQYDLVDAAAILQERGEEVKAAVVLNSPSVKGLVWIKEQGLIADDTAESKPKGTFVSCKLPVEGGLLFKTFVLA